MDTVEQYQNLFAGHQPEESLPTVKKAAPTFIQGEEADVADAQDYGGKDFNQQRKENKANFSMISLNQITGSLDSSYQEVDARATSVGFMSLMTGLEESLVSRNFDAIAQRLYPNQSLSPEKLTSNYNALLHDAKMRRDLQEWYTIEANGDTSERTRQEISMRERNLMSTRDFINLYPEGTIKREMEEAFYSLGKNWPNMKDSIIVGTQNAIKYGTVTFATAIAAVLSGGMAAPIVGNTLSDIMLSDQVVKATMAGAAIGRNKGVYDYQQRQMIGAEYGAMINRLKDEGIPFEQQTVAQMSRITGSLTAAIATAEFEMKLKTFGFNKIVEGGINKGVLEVVKGKTFMNFLGEALGQRVKALGASIGSETIGELAEESLSFVLQQYFMEQLGSTVETDTYVEHMKEVLWPIVRDTVANTTVYGLGIGGTGAAIQSSIYYNNNKSNIAPKLSRPEQSALNSLNTFETTDFKMEEGVMKTTLSPEKARFEGQKIADTIIENPQLAQYISPAQKKILETYMEEHQPTLLLSRGIEIMTDKSLSEIDGLGTYSEEDMRSNLDTVSKMRFTGRLLQTQSKVRIGAGPVVDGDYTGSIDFNEDGTLQVTVSEGEATAVVNAKVNSSGGVSITGIEESTFENREDIPKAMAVFLPPEMMYDSAFDVDSKVGKEVLATVEAMSSIDIMESSQETLQNISDTVKESETVANYRRILTDGKPDDKVETYHEIESYNEYYYEEEAFEEEVIINDPLPPEETVDVSFGVDQFEGFGVASEAITYFEEQLRLFDNPDYLENMNEEAKTSYKSKIEKGLAYQKKLIRDMEEMGTDGELNTYDAITSRGIKETEEDVELVVKYREELIELDKSYQRIIDKKGKNIITDSWLKKEIEDYYEAIIQTLEDHEISNHDDIINGKLPQKNTQGLVQLKKDMNAYVTGEESAPLSKSEQVVKDLQVARSVQLDNIIESGNKVIDRHNGDMAFKDVKGTDRRNLLLEKYSSELTIEAQRYYDGDYSSAKMAELSAERIELHESVKTLNSIGISTDLSLISSQSRALGDVDIYDIAALTRSVLDSKTEIKKEEEIRTEMRTETRNVRKKRTKTRLVEKKKNVSGDATFNEHFVGYQILSGVKREADSVLSVMDDMIRTIKRIGNNLGSLRMQEVVNNIALKHGFVYNDAYSVGDYDPLENTEGISPEELIRREEHASDTLRSMPFNKLQEIYKEVVAAGKTDIKLTAYKAGGVEIPFSKYIRQIRTEIVTNPYTKFFRAFVKDKAAVSRIYDNSLMYDLLIEKIQGRQSLIYKVMYEDINTAFRQKENFVHNFKTKYTEEFQALPGALTTNEYFSQTYLVADEEITQEMYLSLKQAQRSGYNWNAMKEGGIMVRKEEGWVSLGEIDTKKIMEWAELKQTTEADLHVINTFQRAMDDLWIPANRTKMKLYGSALKQSKYYINLETDPELDELFRPVKKSSEDQISLVFESSMVHDRLGTKKPVHLVPLGMVYEDTVQSISNFAYTDEVFTRAEAVINKPAIQQALNKRFGEQYTRFISNGLKRWTGERMSRTEVEVFMDKTRSRFGASILAGNIEVSAKQILSFPLFGRYVGASHLMQGVMDVSKDMKKVHETLMAWSPLYQARQENMGKHDIQDYTDAKKYSGFKRGSRKLERIQWAPLKGADRVTVMTGMQGAMNQFNAEVERGYFSLNIKDALDIDDSIIAGISPETRMQLAAKFAEHAVERTQPMQDAQHTSDFQRATWVSRGLSAFGSYTNQVNNLMARNFYSMARGEPGAIRGFANVMAMAMVVVPSITSLFDATRKQAREKFLKKDEITPFWDIFKSSFFNNVTGYWFVVRNIVPAIRDLVKGKYVTQIDIGMPILEMGEVWMKGTYHMWNAKDSTRGKEERLESFDKGFENYVKGISYISGIGYYPARIAFDIKERLSKD